MINKIFLLLTLFVSIVSCGGRGLVRSDADDVTMQQVEKKNVVQPPVRYTFKVKHTYDHSSDAYTQGLVWHEGVLYEGTGQRGESCLKVTQLDGKQLKSMPLAANLFGEGVAILKDRIYQLTWTSGQAFVYDLNSFRKIKVFHYRGEGWGLTTDGKMLYMSDGSDTIFVRDPETFEIKHTISVVTDMGVVRYLNELEWINGNIWANVYTTDNIVIIDPESGHVKGVVDLGGLMAEEDKTARTEVLNGIAFDATSGRIFVTGKYWSKLYEIEVVPQN